MLGNAIVPWWRSQAYYDSGAWRGTWALDGGVLMNQSIHSIDILQWLMGPVKSLYAYTDRLAHRMETEDVAVAILRFKNGALGAIAATTGAYPGGYQVLQPWLRYTHVKDARLDGSVVAAGEGVARWPDLLQQLRKDSYDGFFSLEPHLAAAGNSRDSAVRIYFGTPPSPSSKC